ncbi:MAG: hypothetical protein OQK25_00985 [Gammaproteobacteria bacterium]|nr:hypothetical protein [Gammaproteobacteria bacterium]
MDDLIIDDRASPDQTIRGSVDRRHTGDRRTNPFSGSVHQHNERLCKVHELRAEGRRE